MIKKVFTVFAVMFLFILISPTCVIASDMQSQHQIVVAMNINDLTGDEISYEHPANQNQELQLSLKIINVGTENISNIQILIVAVLPEYIMRKYGNAEEMAPPIDDASDILNASGLMGNAYEVKPSRTIKITELPQGGFVQENLTLIFKTAGSWNIYTIRVYDNGSKSILSSETIEVSRNLPKHMDVINFGLPFAFADMLTILAYLIHKKRKLKIIS